MPITHKIEKGEASILVWEITETLEGLLDLYGNINTSNYTSEKRKKEHLISRLMVNKICKNGAIIYNEFGAPELDNAKHLSISHSNELVTIIISNKKTGLDIEKISEKALRTASKFVAEKNLMKLNKEKATLIWCIKEAVYKWHQKGGIDFIKDIIIAEFFAKEHGNVTAYFMGKKINLNYLKINNHYLVYVCS
jgi:4'-phosphopantetheinyl transferase|tara:strand:- start:122 stop:703 length:582 start_codon:yes stop_codon:yes gene_type:complete